MKPINLNKVRKAKARIEKKTRADANAASFGRTKAERQAETTERAKQERALDNHKLDK